MLHPIRKLLNVPWYIGRLFTSTSHDLDDYVEELWTAGWPTESKRRSIRSILRPPRKNLHRFQNETTDKYSARVTPVGLELQSHTRNLFAWTDDPLYRYRDVVISASISFLSEFEATYGAGIIFRKVDDTSFYDCIVSTDGLFRFDVVFNGNQIPLIAWTEIPEFNRNGTLQLQIIARGSRFSFYIDDNWIGEIADDTIDSGNIAFAIQNYNDADRITALLARFSIDSRPVEVEATWYRFTSLIPAPPERRSVLARTFAKMGQFASAGVQLKKLQQVRALNTDERLLLATCRLNNGDVENALVDVEAAIENDAESKEAVVEKANILYLQNRMLDLKQFLNDHIDRVDDLPGIWNLAGNCAYALGEWDDSIDAYRRAIELQPDMPLFHGNLGRSFERSSRIPDAVDAYVNASRLLFREESYEELERILARLGDLDPEHPQVASIKGKLAFHDGNFNKAMSLFSHLIDSDEADSSVYFLQGIILTHYGDPGAGTGLFQRAVDMDADVPVYWLKYAENLFTTGKDPSDALVKARELAPADPWVLNLAGLVELEEDLPAPAVELFRAAHSNAADEPEITANLAEALYRNGEPDEAYLILRNQTRHAACMNELGRLYTADERYDDAVDAFTQATKLDTDNTAYLDDLAAAYVEADQILQAEELLAQLLDTGPTAVRYNLMGHVAQAKGEVGRAESAYLEALKIEPGNEIIACNLADHYMRYSKYDDAGRTLDLHLPKRTGERITRLRNRIRSATQVRVVCASCGREWWAPKDLELQPRLVIKGEPPDESPAGRCGVCGKVYCVACARDNVREGRFICTSCDEPLKLSDDRLKYLVARYVS